MFLWNSQLLYSFSYSFKKKKTSKDKDSSVQWFVISRSVSLFCDFHWTLEVSMCVALVCDTCGPTYVHLVTHTAIHTLQSLSLSFTHTQTHMHTLTYPLKHAYAHIQGCKVKQLSWSHNQTVESCWGTLNKKECSLSVHVKAPYQLPWSICQYMCICFHPYYIVVNV